MAVAVVIVGVAVVVVLMQLLLLQFTCSQLPTPLCSVRGEARAGHWLCRTRRTVRPLHAHN